MENRQPHPQVIFPRIPVLICQSRAPAPLPLYGYPVRQAYANFHTQPGPIAYRPQVPPPPVVAYRPQVPPPPVVAYNQHGQFIAVQPQQQQLPMQQHTEYSTFKQNNPIAPKRSSAIRIVDPNTGKSVDLTSRPSMIESLDKDAKEFKPASPSYGSPPLPPITSFENAGSSTSMSIPNFDNELQFADDLTSNKNKEESLSASTKDNVLQQEFNNEQLKDKAFENVAQHSMEWISSRRGNAHSPPFSNVGPQAPKNVKSKLSSTTMRNDHHPNQKSRRNFNDAPPPFASQQHPNRQQYRNGNNNQLNVHHPNRQQYRNGNNNQLNVHHQKQSHQQRTFAREDWRNDTDRQQRQMTSTDQSLSIDQKNVSSPIEKADKECTAHLKQYETTNDIASKLMVDVSKDDEVIEEVAIASSREIVELDSVETSVESTIDRSFNRYTQKELIELKKSPNVLSKPPRSGDKLLNGKLSHAIWQILFDKNLIVNQEYSNESMNSSQLCRNKPRKMSNNNMRDSNANITRSKQSQEKEIIKIHLTSQEIQLNECQNAWKPDRLKVKDQNMSDEEQQKEKLQRNFRSTLNKITAENFNHLLGDLRDTNKYSINTVDKLKAIIEILFEKSIAEPGFAPIYAKLFKVLSEVNLFDQNEINIDGKKTRNPWKLTLISRCQEEFERCAKDDSSMHEAEMKIKEAKTLEEKDECEQNLIKLRLRGFGTILFIGELYKLNFLTTKIMQGCINRLIVSDITEENIERCCKLLNIIGENLEREMKDEEFEEVFRQLRYLREKFLQTTRIKFEIDNIEDLKKRKWAPRFNAGVNKTNPKTMQQLADEDKQEQMRKNAQLQDYQDRTNNNNNRHYGGSNNNHHYGGSNNNHHYGGSNNNHHNSRSKNNNNHHHNGRSKNNNNDNNHDRQSGKMKHNNHNQHEKQSEQRSYRNDSFKMTKIDFNKININRNGSEMKLGPTSNHWQNFGKPQPMQNGFENLSSDFNDADKYLEVNNARSNLNNKSNLKDQSGNDNQTPWIEKPKTPTEPELESEKSDHENDQAFYINLKTDEMAIKEQLESNLSAFMRGKITKDIFMKELKDIKMTENILACVYNGYLDKKRSERDEFIEIVIELLENGMYTKVMNVEAMTLLMKTIPDIIYDVPQAYEYIGDYYIPLINAKMLTIEDIENICESEASKETLNYVGKLFAVKVAETVKKSEESTVENIIEPKKSKSSSNNSKQKTKSEEATVEEPKKSKSSRNLKKQKKLNSKKKYTQSDPKSMKSSPEWDSTISQSELKSMQSAAEKNKASSKLNNEIPEEIASKSTQSESKSMKSDSTFSQSELKSMQSAAEKNKASSKLNNDIPEEIASKLIPSESKSVKSDSTISQSELKFMQSTAEKNKASSKLNNKIPEEIASKSTQSESKSMKSDSTFSQSELKSMQSAAEKNKASSKLNNDIPEEIASKLIPSESKSVKSDSTISQSELKFMQSTAEKNKASSKLNNKIPEEIASKSTQSESKSMKSDSTFSQSELKSMQSAAEKNKASSKLNNDIPEEIASKLIPSESKSVKSDSTISQSELKSMQSAAEKNKASSKLNNKIPEEIASKSTQSESKSMKTDSTFSQSELKSMQSAAVKNKASSKLNNDIPEEIASKSTQSESKPMKSDSTFSQSELKSMQSAAEKNKASSKLNNKIPEEIASKSTQSESKSMKSDSTFSQSKLKSMQSAAVKNKASSVKNKERTLGQLMEFIHFQLKKRKDTYRQNIFESIECNTYDHTKKPEFISELTVTILKTYYDVKNKTPKISLVDWLDILIRYIDNDITRQTFCINGIQQYAMKNNPEKIGEMFEIFYESDVISTEAYKIWQSKPNKNEDNLKAIYHAKSFFAKLGEA